jgi:uncharacterized membrane protein
MLSGILFLAVVVLLAFGIRWISHHNDPVYKKTADQKNSSLASEAVLLQDKKEIPGKRS